MSQPTISSESTITVRWLTRAGARHTRLTAPFCIGADPSGDLHTDERAISRTYVGVFRRDGRWWVRDLGCPDGLLLNGTRLESGVLPRRATLALGSSGPEVMLETDEPAAQTGHTPAVPQSRDDGRAANRTVLHGFAPRSPLPSPGSDAPQISVRVGSASTPRHYRHRARIGRDSACDIQVDDDGVSRAHAEIFPIGAQWCVRDLGSSNGTYLDGQRVQEAVLPARCALRLGADGPSLELTCAAQAAAQAAGGATPPQSVEDVVAHYFDPKSSAPAGQRTMMVRRAFSTVQRRQQRKYGSVIAGALGLLLVAIAVAAYQYVQLQRTRGLAEQIFYNMKALELQLARLEEQLEASADPAHRAEAEKGRTQLAEMASQYDALLEELGVLDDSLPAEDRLILRMARVFGECEVAMPKGFIDEVKRYIDVWRADQRLADALQQARAQQLPPLVTRVMLDHHMPPQFFYVALQESDFRPQAVGPETRFGIAKGMWQLMPQTAGQYGLRTGPLLGLRQFDPDDERFNPDAATQAAARYLRDLYRGEAQASGLLVLASYNWGPTRVKKLIRAMKENPRDRNFWALLAQKDIPKETRDYVFLIFAAAVIGEDPKLFGFEFGGPLASADAV